MTLNFQAYSLFFAPDDRTFLWRDGREGLGGGSFWSNEPFPFYGQNWDFIDVDDFWDPVALLPPDPFGMNSESTVNALASCIGSLTAMSMSGCGSFHVGDDTLFMGLNDFQRMCLKLDFKCEDPSCWVAGELPSVPSVYMVDGNILQHDSLLQELTSSDPTSSDRVCSELEHFIPHDGMLFALRYLGIQDLLRAEMVCKSLRSAINNDPLLWNCIHIDDDRLGENLNDDDLYRLCQKSHGGLNCLSLVNCSKVTDEGLQRVLENNPHITKLNVYGCLRLTFEGFISGLKAMKQLGGRGIKHLRVGKLFSLSKDQYQELFFLLDTGKHHRHGAVTQHFFHLQSPPFGCCDEDFIDIDRCLMCQNYKFVYDCPSEDCKDGSCKACLTCLQRCMECGICIREHSLFHELFSLDLQCFKCRALEESEMNVAY